MVKLRELSNKQLVAQIEKHEKIYFRLKEEREKREERRVKIGASSIHCIFIESRGHIHELRKNTNKRQRVFLAEMLKSRGRQEHGRKLDSLHVYRVPWPPP